MTKKVLYAAALLSLAFAALLPLGISVVKAQQLASNSSHANSTPARRLLKRMAISVGNAPEGSRVRVTSDAPFDGYQTYADGGKFFVRIADADATTLATAGLAGRGLSRIEAEQSGDDAIIAFTFEPTYAPRVRANFNRLEVVFAEQQ